MKFIREEIGVVENKNIPIGEGRADYIFIHPKSAYGVLIELIEAK